MRSVLDFPHGAANPQDMYHQESLEKGAPQIGGFHCDESEPLGWFGISMD